MSKLRDVLKGGDLKTLRWDEAQNEAWREETDRLRTMSHMAASYKRLDMLEYLFDRKMLEMSSKDAWGMTVLSCCVAPQGLNFVDEVARSHRRTSKEIAKDDLESVKMLKWLHEKGLVDANLEDTSGATLAFTAAAFELVDTLDWLQHHGLLQPWSTKHSSGNIVFFCARYGLLRPLQWMYEQEEELKDAKETKKADGLWKELKKPNPKNGIHLVHYAASSGHLDLLKWLHFKNIDDIQAADVNGNNVATYAARELRIDVITWLHHLRLLPMLIRHRNDLSNAVSSERFGYMRYMSLQGMEKSAWKKKCKMDAHANTTM